MVDIIHLQEYADSYNENEKAGTRAAGKWEVASLASPVGTGSLQDRCRKQRCQLCRSSSHTYTDRSAITAN